MSITPSKLLKISLAIAIATLGFHTLHADEAPPPGTSRVYVKIAPNQKGNAISQIANAGGHVHFEFDNIGAVAATLPDQAINALRNSNSVLNIEPDPVRFLNAETTPYGIQAVQADQAVTAGAVGAGVVVGVIDSGIYPAHEDFSGIVIDGYPSEIVTQVKGRGKPRDVVTPLTEDDEAYWGRDLDGHGTHVSGTIAAVGNNNLGVVGVSPGKVDIFMVKVFGDDDSWIYSSTLVDAAQRAQAAGATVINMSLGGPTPSSSEQAGMDQLLAQGVTLVAAAGNDGNTAHNYPASYDSVISVAAVDRFNAIADFSQQNSQVEIAAPGVGVISTVPYIDDASIAVGGSTLNGYGIENSAFTSQSGVSGELVDGGLAASTNPAWAEKVVLVQRGDISFYDKVLNVQNSGGVAAIIYNNEAGALLATLGDGNSTTIPGISLSDTQGADLKNNHLGSSVTVINYVEAPASSYQAWDGTSMATPHVVGGIALLQSAYPDATPENIREAIATTALDLGASGRDNAFGFGLLQLNAALLALPGIMNSGSGGGGGGEDPALVVSNVRSEIVNAKRGAFRIRWSTNVAADSALTLANQVYTDDELKTEHSFNFRGKKGATYSYTVSSTTASGDTATEGPFTHSN